MVDRITRVLLVSSQPVCCLGLHELFRQAGNDLQVVGEADTPDAALAATAALQPDVILLDIVLGGSLDTEIVALLRQATPGARLLVFTSISAELVVLDAIRAGASGYLLKDAPLENIVQAVRRVVRNEMPLDPRVASAVLQGLNGLGELGPGSRLSEREMEVLRLMAEGLTNRNIAARLVISERTVGTHVSAVLAKLQVETRTQAVLYAMQRGMVPFHPPH